MAVTLPPAGDGPPWAPQPGPRGPREQTGPRPRPEQWHFALHASRPLSADEIDRLIRLNAALGRAAVVLARPSAWPWEGTPWYSAHLEQSMKQPPPPAREEHKPPPLPLPPAATPHGPVSPRWEGWMPAAAILFTLLLLIVRATERCLSSRLKRGAREGSRGEGGEEWSTPSVRATAAGRGSPRDGSPQTTRLTVEIPPPPYSEIDDNSGDNDLRDITAPDQLAFLRSARYDEQRARDYIEANMDSSGRIPFRNFEELCQIREMLKRKRELQLQPPPSYSSLMLNEAPPYSSVAFNNNETPSVHITNNSQRADREANANTSAVNLANLNPEIIETEVSRVNNSIQGAPVRFNNAQEHENVQGASVNSNINPQTAPVNVRTDINLQHNYVTQSVPSFENNTEHNYITNYEEALTSDDAAPGMADSFEDGYALLPDNASSAYERHFVPDTDVDVANKSLPITESLLANSDVLKRHRRYDDVVTMRRTLQREVDALADEECDEMVTFRGITDEDLIRDIDERDETDYVRERDIELRDETAIELENEINSQYEEMEQDATEVDFAGANDFDDDAKRALDFAETQINDKHNPRV